jgi:predicted nucleic acid-binding protein
LALYLDSSALAKLVLHERETSALASFVEDRTVTSSVVAYVELRRAARRYDRESATLGLLTRIPGIELTDEVIDLAAEANPTSLSSLDAIHLASATWMGSQLDAFVAYDRRLAEAARAAGLEVVSPA